MSRQSASPEMVPLLIDTGARRVNVPDIFTGFITPPDSPTPYGPSKKQQCSSSRQSPNSNSARERREAMQDHQACSRISTPSSVTSSLEPVSPVSSAATDLGAVGEEIYSIVEKVVEHKMADAIAPLRLNINRMESLTSHFHRENTDLGDQNDTMSRQLDLHYRRIEQHTETFHSMTDTLSSMLETESNGIKATANNLAVAGSLVGHLSQLIVNLPVAINQVVQNAVQQQTEMAFDDILQAQREFILAIQDMRQERVAVAASIEDATTARSSSESSNTLGWQGTMTMGQVGKSTSYGGDRGQRGSFRRAMRRLLKVGR